MALGIFKGMAGRRRKHQMGKSLARRMFGSRRAFRKAKRRGAIY